MKWFLELETQYKLTLIGVLLTAIMSAISLYFSVRNNKAVHYVNAITKNRVEWLYKFRDYISTLLCETTIENADLHAKGEVEYESHFSEIERIRNLIYMHLNFADEIDRTIDSCVDKLVACHKDLYDLCCVYYKSESKQEINMSIIHPSIYPVVGKIIAKYYGKSEFKEEMFFPIYDDEIEKEKILGFYMEEVSHYFEKYEEYRDELLRHVRVYLKFEWNRIKIEATGKKYKKNKQSEDLRKLYELYDDSNNKGKE